MADDNLFTVELVTPERILLTGLASEVILRTGEGDVTFLAGHTPLVGSVEPGVARVVRPEGEVERVAVHGGFVQVEQHVGADESDSPQSGGTRVTIMAGIAELADEIDVVRAQTALENGEARLSELGGATRPSGSGSGSGDDSDVDIELVEAEAALLRAQIRIEATDASLSAGAGANSAS